MIKKYNELIKFLEKSEYSFDKNLIKKHCIDWREEFLGTSNLIIFPKSVEKLSKFVIKKILRLFLREEILV